MPIYIHAQWVNYGKSTYYAEDDSRGIKCINTHATSYLLIKTKNLLFNFDLKYLSIIIPD